METPMLLKQGGGSDLAGSDYTSKVYGDMNKQVPMSNGEGGNPSNNEIAGNLSAAQQYRGGSRKRKARKSKKSKKSKKTMKKRGGRRRRSSKK